MRSLSVQLVLISKGIFREGFFQVGLVEEDKQRIWCKFPQEYEHLREPSDAFDS